MLAMRQSKTLTALSTPALAITNGRYLFQSIERSSVPETGTVRTAAETGSVNELAVGPDAYAGVRKSNILTVPSVEHVARMSGWCGEKSA